MQTTTRRRTRALLAAAVVVVSFVAADTPPPADAARTTVDPHKVRWSRTRPDFIRSVRTTRPVVALSFDDGPGPEDTPRVLDLLRATGAKATFFVEGDAALGRPDLVRRMVEEGHEVANHTFSHPDLPPLDYDQVVDEVERASDAIRAAGVSEVPLFRPPRGMFDREAADAVRSTGHLTVGWDVCLEKYLARHDDNDTAVAATLARVKPGSIVLAHDGGIPDRERTVEALPALLRGLQGKGFEVVTVTELLRDAR
ncbi:MAG TPA: polysaccharide deacetylase family protein [Acidimicrobiales bacterium]|nr:polysaccharide deacetylase family protein [Acidimicrobiales bacterium]